MLKEDHSVLEFFNEKNIYDSPDIYDSPSVSTLYENLDNELMVDDIYGSPHFSQKYDDLYNDSFYETETEKSAINLIDLNNGEDRLLLTSALDSMQQSIASMQIKMKDMEYIGERFEYPQSSIKRILCTPTKDKKYHEDEMNSEDNNMINICISGQTIHSNSISICISPNPADEISNVNSTSVSFIEDTIIAYSTETTMPAINIDDDSFRTKEQKVNMISLIKYAMILILIVFAVFIKRNLMLEVSKFDLFGNTEKMSSEVLTTVDIEVRTSNLINSDDPKLLLQSGIIDDRIVLGTISICKDISSTTKQLGNSSINTHSDNQLNSNISYINTHNNNQLVSNSYLNEIIQLDNTHHTSLPKLSKPSLFHLAIINLCSKFMNRIKYIIEILFSRRKP